MKDLPRDSRRPASTTEHLVPTPFHKSVSPALARYIQSTLLEGVWKRPGLAVRHRSLITLAALISRNQVVEIRPQLDLALDNGVKPSEVSETITQLAFYSGWPNASSAASVAKEVFAQRGIAADQLPAASGGLLPLDELLRRSASRPLGSWSARQCRALCIT